MREVGWRVWCAGGGKWEVGAREKRKIDDTGWYEGLAYLVGCIYEGCVHVWALKA